MSVIEISEQLVSWALRCTNLTEDHLADKFPKIREWTAGAKHPTLRQLECFAQTTRTSLGYFFLDEPPNESLPIPHSRTLDAFLWTRWASSSAYARISLNLQEC